MSEECVLQFQFIWPVIWGSQFSGTYRKFSPRQRTIYYTSRWPRQMFGKTVVQFAGLLSYHLFPAHVRFGGILNPRFGEIKIYDWVGRWCCKDTWNWDCLGFSSFTVAIRSNFHDFRVSLISILQLNCVNYAWWLRIMTYPLICSGKFLRIFNLKHFKSSVVPVLRDGTIASHPCRTTATILRPYLLLHRPVTVQFH